MVGVIRCPWAVLAVIIVAGCQISSSYDDNGRMLEPRRFGRFEGEAPPPTDSGPRPDGSGPGPDSGGPGPSASFGPRLGPRTALWADVFGGAGPAPIQPGDSAGSLSGFTGVAGDGPSVLVDGLAVYSDGASTIAVQLATGAEAWRATGELAIEPEGMLTDGTLLCGLSRATDRAICLELATGTQRMVAPISGGPSGLLAEGEIRDGLFTFAAGGYLVVVDIASSTVLWQEPTYSLSRQFVRVGDDLLYLSAIPCSSASAYCLLSVDPRTGTMRAMYEAYAPAFMFEQGGEAIFTLYYGMSLPSGRQVLAYSPATDTFRQATEWGEIYSTNPMAFTGFLGLTPVLEDGSVYLWTGNAVCRVETGTKTISWCAAIDGIGPRELRIHGNGIFYMTRDGDQVAGVPSASVIPTGYAKWFESWGFVGGDYHALP